MSFLDSILARSRKVETKKTTVTNKEPVVAKAEQKTPEVIAAVSKAPVAKKSSVKKISR